MLSQSPLLVLLTDELQPDAIEEAEPVREPAPPATDEVAQKRRERLLKNLEKGRKTALENRRKRALLKRMESEEKKDKMDTELKSRIMKQQTASDAQTTIESLRSELEQLKAQKKSAPPQEEPVVTSPLARDPPASTPSPSKASQPRRQSNPPSLEPAAEPEPEPAPQPEPAAALPEPPAVVLSTFSAPPW